MKGENITMAQGWQLAKEWYSDRLSPEWRRKNAEEIRDTFQRVGLTSPFWQIPG